MSEVPPAAPIQVGSSGTAGGYKFNHDEVKGVISQWKQLKVDLATDLRNAQQIANVQPPGKEFASGDFVSQGADPSGQTLLEQHQRMSDYVDNYIAALEKASGNITNAEDDAQQAVNKQNKGF